MSFDKLEKQTVSEQVFNALRQQILDRRIEVGDKLPSEGDLSDQFGVSKASVKAALQRLSTLGLIETRVGQGSFILEFDPHQYMDQVQDILLNDSDISNIVEYRMYIEMAATRLAIKKATEENFKKMEVILDRMDEAAENNDAELHGQYDYQFHLEIWKSTRNETFEMAYEIIGKMLLKHIALLNKEYIRKSKSFMTGRDDIHRCLLKSIREKDIEQCRECYLSMFSVYKSLPPEQFRDC